MDDKKKNIIIIVIGCVIGVLGIVVGIFNKETQKQSILPVDNLNEVTRIKTYDIFFAINNIISELYSNISSRKGDYIINVYSNDYLVQNGLNSSNIIEKTNPNLRMISKYITDNYYVCNKDNCYIYLTLDGVSRNMLGSVFNKLEPEYIMIRLDLSNSAYDITPLSNDKSLYEYAKEYPSEKISIKANTYNIYSLQNPSAEDVIVYYLSYTKNMLLIDANKVKDKIINYDEEKLNDYTNNLGNVLYSYENQSDDFITKYHGMLYNGTLFTMEIKSPMDFTIEFN